MSISLSIDEIAGGVVVIAPHPDDETLGCGGLIGALVDKGVEVHTVFVTDGSSSHRNSATWPASRIAELREDEATRALERLGAGRQPRTFLRLKDAAMPQKGEPAYEEAVNRVASILYQSEATLLLVPWRRDPHCDHRDSWSMAIDAIGRSGLEPTVLEYAIWLEELGATADFPLAGEVEVVTFEAAGMVDRKHAALNAHASQLGQVILDDPDGFSLTDDTISRLIRPYEVFWRA